MRNGASDLRGGALLSISAVLAIIFSAVLCLFLQDLAPSGAGPVYDLFPYNGEVVAIGLIGGVLPLLLSAAMVGARAGTKKDDEHDVPFRSQAYWLAIALIALLLTAFFTAAHALYGGLGLPKLWAFWLVFAGAVAGVDYWWLRGKRLAVLDATAECYVMGTLGVFESDLVRTLTGLASAPGRAAVWGGGGFLDILFWFGLYAALSFLSFSVVRRLLGRAGRADRRAPKDARPP